MVKERPVATSEMQRFTASDIAAGDLYGGGVFTNEAGTIAVVTSYLDDNGNGTDAGSVYVYSIVGGVATLQAKLLSSTVKASDFYGSSANISADGSTIAVGAYGNDKKASMAGCVFVYTKVNNVWTQQAQLVASDGLANNYFGYTTVSLSADGNYLVATSYMAKVGGVAAAGAAYVFVRNGSTWTQQAKIVPDDPGASDYFGSACDLSADGATLIVCSSHDDISGAVDAGSVYVYTRTGTVWTKQAKLISPIPAASDFFGFAAAISSDGTTIVISSPYQNAFGADSGVVHVFTKVNGVWTLKTALYPNGLSAGDYFGYSLSISSDGKVIAIGASGDATVRSTAGAVYIFIYRDISGTWEQTKKLTGSDVATVTSFGQSVDMSSDGTKLLVGSNTPTAGTNSGAVYLFQ